MFTCDQHGCPVKIPSAPLKPERAEIIDDLFNGHFGHCVGTGVLLEYLQEAGSHLMSAGPPEKHLGNQGFPRGTLESPWIISSVRCEPGCKPTTSLYPVFMANWDRRDSNEPASPFRWGAPTISWRLPQCQILDRCRVHAGLHQRPLHQGEQLGAGRVFTWYAPPVEGSL